MLCLMKGTQEHAQDYFAVNEDCDGHRSVAGNKRTADLCIGGAGVKGTSET